MLKISYRAMLIFYKTVVRSHKQFSKYSTEILLSTVLVYSKENIQTD